MLRSMMLASTLLSLTVAAGLVASPVGGEQPAGAATNSEPATTKLFQEFDAGKLASRQIARFGKHPELSAVGDLKITPPGRWFKTFRIKGTIPDDDPKPILASVQRDLDQLLTDAGVTVVEKQESVDARPISLLKTLCPTYQMKISSLQGRHISYHDETASGELDLVAFQFVDKEAGELKWCVLCALHEPAEAAK